MKLNAFLLLLFSVGGYSFKIDIFKENNDENGHLFDIIGNIVITNIEKNGWQNILFMGKIEDVLFNTLKTLNFTFTVMNSDTKMMSVDDNVELYPSNTIIMSCDNFGHFQNSMKSILKSPFWHPHANIILLYHDVYEEHLTSKIFYILWYYKAVNAIMIHRKQDKILISKYSPYSNDFYALDYKFGCWFTALPIKDFNKSFKCEENCNNVTIDSNLRANNYGTCISFSTQKISNSEYNTIQNRHLFEEKGKNLHGYALRSYGIQVLPFLTIEGQKNKNKLSGRDGLIWTTLAELMNFSIHLLPNTINNNFNYRDNIQQLYLHGQRKIDLILFPVYQFDLRIAPTDYTFPFVDSGVCFISHDVGMIQVILGSNFVKKNYNVIILFFVNFFCIWFVYFIYNSEEIETFTYDQAGKDLMNAFRMVFIISIPKLPQRKSFRIFFGIALWGFVLYNFMSQAIIISMFSSAVHGKNTDTFEDVNGYIQGNKKVLEGMASPDIFLAKSDPKLNVIFSKLNHRMDLFECIRHLKNDTNRICLIDCNIGHYLERNEINEKGEQYLHVAKTDKVHSLYLNMIFNRHSPLTKHFNRHLTTLVEAGIIKKWMQSRDKLFQKETPLKVLNVEDLKGVFVLTFLYIGFSLNVFIIEIILCKFRSKQ